MRGREIRRIDNKPKYDFRSAEGQPERKCVAGRPRGGAASIPGRVSTCILPRTLSLALKPVRLVCDCFALQARE